MSPIPRRDPSQVYSEDLRTQEQNPDTLDIKFFEPSPVNKITHEIRPDDNGVLVKLRYSLGPDDGSLNGYILAAITRIPNINLYATSQAQNQIIWNTIIFGKGDTGVEHFASDKLHGFPVYLYKGEPIYVTLISNFPAPCKVFGQITLTVMPAFR